MKKIQDKYVNLLSNIDTEVVIKDKIRERKYKLKANEEIRNIVVDRPGTVLGDGINCEVIYKEEEVEVETSNKRTYSKEQEEVNKNTVEVNNVFFEINGNIKNPEKLFIFMPIFSRENLKVKHILNKYEILGDDFLKKNAVLSFQDLYAEYGTFLLLDDDNKSLIEKVNFVIKSFIKKFNLLENQLVFYGNSKGGTSAIIYGSNYPKAKIIAIAPMINAKILIQGSSHNSECIYQDIFEKSELDLIKYINLINKNKQDFTLYEGTEDKFHINSFTKDYYKNENFNLVLKTNSNHTQINNWGINEFNFLMMLKEGSLIKMENNNEYTNKIKVLNKSNDMKYMFLSLDKKFDVNENYVLNADNQLTISLEKKEMLDGKIGIYISRVDNKILDRYILKTKIKDYSKIKLQMLNKKEKSLEQIELTNKKLSLISDKIIYDDINTDRYKLLIFEKLDTHIRVTFKGNSEKDLSMYKNPTKVINTYLKIADEKNGEKLIHLNRFTKYSYQTNMFIGWTDLGFEINDKTKISLLEFQNENIYTQEINNKDIINKESTVKMMDCFKIEQMKIDGEFIFAKFSSNGEKAKINRYQKPKSQIITYLKVNEGLMKIRLDRFSTLEGYQTELVVPKNIMAYAGVTIKKGDEIGLVEIHPDGNIYEQNFLVSEK